MSILKGANLALRFLLELSALAALCYWGFKTGTGTISKVVLGIGAPLATAVLWSTFVAPAAPVSSPGALRFLLELAVFGVAAAALYSAGRPGVTCRLLR
jgi:hypothetical protein